MLILLATLASVTAWAQPAKFEDRHPAYADEPTPKSVRTIPISPAHTFEERWEPVRELLEQQQRRKAMIEPSPEQVAPAVAPAPRERPRRATEALLWPTQEVCRKNGLHTVWADGGKRWRCRR